MPLRVPEELNALLGAGSEAQLLVTSPDTMPAFRYVLPRPAATAVGLRVNILSKAGIPLASALIELRPGDEAVLTAPLTLLAMEGYGHLKTTDRLAVERRVWSRRSYATIERA